MATEHAYLRDLMGAYVRGDRALLAAPSGLDWERFTRLLVDHKIAGTLLPLVDRDGLDPKLDQWLGSIRKSFARSTILRLLHLESVLATLRGAGCRPIVLKGGVLATDYYARAEDRYLNDLDILVDRSDVETACFAMGELGLDFVDTKAQRLYYEKYHFHWIMGDVQGNVVEIHWDLNLVESMYHFDLEGLRRRAVTVDLNGTEMVTPEPADMLLHIVTQSVEGGFHELRHLIDAALILPRVGAPEALVRRAREQNMQIALWALMHRLSRWIDVPIPAALLEGIEPRGATANLLRHVLDDELYVRTRLLNGHDLNQHFNWMCAPTARQRWRALRHIVFPGESHWLEHGAASQVQARGWNRIKLPLGRLRNLAKLLVFGARGAPHASETARS